MMVTGRGNMIQNEVWFSITSRLMVRLFHDDNQKNIRENGNDPVDSGLMANEMTFGNRLRLISRSHEGCCGASFNNQPS